MMSNTEIIEVLSEMVSENRISTFNEVLDNRTRYITVVLEDIFQSHNASAVIRSCDCSGIQDVHMIENSYKFAENPDVALGSSQWITKFKYNSQENNTLEAIQTLRNDAYRIVATTPHTDDTLLSNLDLSKGKIALFFGSERPGLSKIVMDNADEFVKIPMYGFTESYNISVSAALCLYDIVNRLRKTEINWHLSFTEKQELLAQWLKISVKDSTNILKLIEKRRGSGFYR
jgi:tRNA (guanosine-2'-O-)-methyltransferase